MSEIIIPVIGGIFIIAAAFLAFLGTRGKTRADAKSAMDARIDERVGDELDRLYARVDMLDAELQSLHRRLDDAEGQIDAGERQAVEMISHIVVLEGLVPDPPGPPTRPNWKLPILGERHQGERT